MSTKKKLAQPEPKPEPVTEPAPKKAVKKRVVKPAAQRVVETPAEPILVVPAVQLPAPEQHGEAVQPALPAIEPVIEQPEPVKLTLSQRWHNFKNSTWFWVTLAVFALIILWAVIAEIQRVKVNKVVKQTEKVETKITDGKGELQQTEQHLPDMQQVQKKLDSMSVTIDSLQKVNARQLEHDQITHELAKKYKLQNYELQNLIRDANDSILIHYGEKSKY